MDSREGAAQRVRWAKPLSSSEKGTSLSDNSTKIDVNELEEKFSKILDSNEDMIASELQSGKLDCIEEISDEDAESSPSILLQDDDLSRQNPSPTTNTQKEQEQFSNYADMSLTERDAASLRSYTISRHKKGGIVSTATSFDLESYDLDSSMTSLHDSMPLSYCNSENTPDATGSPLTRSVASIDLNSVATRQRKLEDEPSRNTVDSTELFTLYVPHESQSETSSVSGDNGSTKGHYDHHSSSKDKASNEVSDSQAIQDLATMVRDLQRELKVISTRMSSSPSLDRSMHKGSSTHNPNITESIKELSLQVAEMWSIVDVCRLSQRRLSEQNEVLLRKYEAQGRQLDDVLEQHHFLQEQLKHLLTSLSTERKRLKDSEEVRNSLHRQLEATQSELDEVSQAEMRANITMKHMIETMSQREKDPDTYNFDPFKKSTYDENTASTAEQTYSDSSSSPRRKFGNKGICVGYGDDSLRSMSTLGSGSFRRSSVESGFGDSIRSLQSEQLDLKRTDSTSTDQESGDTNWLRRSISNLFSRRESLSTTAAVADKEGDGTSRRWSDDGVPRSRHNIDTGEHKEIHCRRWSDDGCSRKAFDSQEEETRSAMTRLSRRLSIEANMEALAYKDRESVVRTFDESSPSCKDDLEEEYLGDEQYEEDVNDYDGPRRSLGRINLSKQDSIRSVNSNGTAKDVEKFFDMMNCSERTSSAIIEDFDPEDEHKPTMSMMA